MRDPTLLSVRVRPLTFSEVLLLRLLSRIEGRPATLFRMATRFRFLRHAIGTSLGCRAARGLSAAEAALVFLLVDHPAETAEELRLKAASVRDHLDATGNGNAAAMLCAGLQADAHRLGLLAGAEAVGYADPAFH